MMTPGMRKRNQSCSARPRRCVRGLPLSRVSALFVSFLLAGQASLAQSPKPGGMPPPPGMSLVNSAAMRFPQPVRVGHLLHMAVLRPVESQALLGTVRQVVREPDGTVAVVIAYGGLLGWGSRLVAVPVDAMVLVGQIMEVVAFTPEQLRRFPNFLPGETTPVQADAIIKVGLAKPSH